MLPIEKVVAELERVEGVPALTAYLRTDGFRGVRMELAASLSTQLEPVRKRLPWRGPEAAAFEAEARVVEARLPTLLCGQRGVAIFSCSRQGLFRSVPLDVALPASAQWGERFALKPLVAALERAERVLFLLVGRDRARAFRVIWDEIEELAPPAHAVPPEQDLPGRAGVTAALALVEERVVRERGERLLVGGEPSGVALLPELVPPALAQRLEACGPLAIDAPTTRVLEVVLERLWHTQRERDDELVEELLRAAVRGQAAVGAGRVAEALAVGDIKRLVVPEGLHLGGGECPSCGLLVPAPAPDDCPACGAALRAVPDLVERIEARVVRGGGRIDEVGGQAAATLAEHEGIGAFLRSPLPPGRG